MDEIPYDVSWSFDARGRDVAQSPAEMRTAVEWLRERAARSQEAEERARLLGLAGGYARMVGNLDVSLALLREAVGLAEGLGRPRLEVSLSTRLAHALHWRGEFAESDGLFEALMRRCRQDERLLGLLDFVLQHWGKSLIDQGRVAEATSCLEEALDLRRRKGDAELVASTELALSVARSAGTR